MTSDEEPHIWALLQTGKPSLTIGPWIIRIYHGKLQKASMLRITALWMACMFALL